MNEIEKIFKEIKPRALDILHKTLGFSDSMIMPVIHNDFIFVVVLDLEKYMLSEKNEEYRIWLDNKVGKFCFSKAVYNPSEPPSLDYVDHERIFEYLEDCIKVILIDIAEDTHKRVREAISIMYKG